MGDVQKLTIDGKNYVILSEDDYEDLVDGMRASAIMARIAAGEEVWPYALVKELSTTDSRIRTYRIYRQMTVDALAQLAGLSSSDLADIESGKTEGSVEALTRIAAALRIDLEDLVVEEVADQ